MASEKTPAVSNTTMRDMGNPLSPVVESDENDKGTGGASGDADHASNSPSGDATMPIDPTTPGDDATALSDDPTASVDTAGDAKAGDSDLFVDTNVERGGSDGPRSTFSSDSSSYDEHSSAADVDAADATGSDDAAPSPSREVSPRTPSWTEVLNMDFGAINDEDGDENVARAWERRNSKTSVESAEERTTREEREMAWKLQSEINAADAGEAVAPHDAPAPAPATAPASQDAPAPAEPSQKIPASAAFSYNGEPSRWYGDGFAVTINSTPAPFDGRSRRRPGSLSSLDLAINSEGEESQRRFIDDEGNELTDPAEVAIRRSGSGSEQYDCRWPEDRNDLAARAQGRPPLSRSSSRHSNRSSSPPPSRPESPVPFEPEEPLREDELEQTGLYGTSATDNLAESYTEGGLLQPTDVDDDGHNFVADTENSENGEDAGLDTAYSLNPEEPDPASIGLADPDDHQVVVQSGTKSPPQDAGSMERGSSEGMERQPTSAEILERATHCKPGSGELMLEDLRNAAKRPETDPEDKLAALRQDLLTRNHQGLEREKYGLVQGVDEMRAEDIVTELKWVRARAHVYRGERQIHRKELDDSRNECAQLKGICNDYWREADRLRRQRNELLDENDKLLKKENSRNDELDEAEALVTRLATERDEDRKRRRKAEEEFKKLQKDYEKCCTSQKQAELGMGTLGEYVFRPQVLLVERLEPSADMINRAETTGVSAPEPKPTKEDATSTGTAADIDSRDTPASEDCQKRIDRPHEADQRDLDQLNAEIKRIEALGETNSGKNAQSSPDEVQKLKTEITQLKAACEAPHECPNCPRHIKEITQLNSRIEGLQQEVKKAMTATQKAGEMATKFNDTKDALGRCRRDLKEEQAQHVKTKEELQQETRKCEEETSKHAQTKQEFENAKSAHQDLDTANADLMAKGQECENEKEQLQARVTELEAAAAANRPTFSQRSATQSDEIRRLRALLQETTQKLQTAKSVSKPTSNTTKTPSNASNTTTIPSTALVSRPSTDDVATVAGASYQPYQYPIQSSAERPSHWATREAEVRQTADFDFTYRRIVLEDIQAFSEVEREAWEFQYGPIDLKDVFVPACPA